MKNNLRVLAGCVFIALASVVCESQVSEGQARQSAETAARITLGTDAPKLLKVRRIEEFEELLFNSQLHVRGRIGYPAYIFAVTATGAFVTSPNEVIYVSSNSFDPKRIVAISKETGKAYALSGFPKADAVFNELTSAIGVQVRDNHDAVMLTRLYYTLVRDPDESQYLENANTLKHRVEDHFAEINADAAFRSWWGRFERLKQKPNIGVEATAKDGFFLSTLTYLGYSKNRPVVRQLVLNISRSGVVKVEADEGFLNDILIHRG
jgi:hypothetical protein